MKNNRTHYSIMDPSNDYREEFQMIQDCIDQSFEKLCLIWDKIGALTEEQRKDMKHEIVCGVVDVTTQYMSNLYNKEMQVSTRSLLCTVENGIHPKWN